MDMISTVGSALGGTAWTVFFFVVALSIIVFIHEYGHYIVGRWSGIHAEVFSLGFGPVLWSRRDKRGTQWQLAAIPFGGFVKFLGDANAASVGSTGGLSAQERRHTMAGAPLWARTLTVSAGPVANFILTFVVLIGLMLSWGITRDEPSIRRLAPGPWDASVLQPGDVITALNGTPTPTSDAFAEVLQTLARDPQITWSVLRDGQALTVQGPHPQPPLVASVQVKSAAIDAGLQAGDVVLRAGGRDLVTFADLQDVVFGSEGQPVPMTIWRNGQTFEQTLTPRRREIPLAEGGFETKWMMGLASGLIFDPATRTPGAFEAIGLTATQMWDMTVTTFSGLKSMIAGQISTCNMSGVIGMAEVMGDAATNGLESFLGMLAVLSLGVGILNLFPIPVLDGGHLVFYAYEAVTRRPPSERALRVLMSVGLTLLLSLMAFALWNDVTCV